MVNSNGKRTSKRKGVSAKSLCDHEIIDESANGVNGEMDLENENAQNEDFSSEHLEEIRKSIDLLTEKVSYNTNYHIYLFSEHSYGNYIYIYIY